MKFVAGSVRIRLAGSGFEIGTDVVEGGLQGGGDERVFVFEVTVETAVSQASIAHHVGHARVFEPLLAEEAGRPLDDAGVTLVHFSLGDSHVPKNPYLEFNRHLLV